MWGVVYRDSTLLVGWYCNRKQSIMFKVVVFVLSWTIPLLNAQKADIIDPPRAVNISIGGIAEFNCTAVAGFFNWRNNVIQLENGKQGVTIAQQTLSKLNQTRISILRINVTSTENATNITCNANIDNPILSTKSSTVLLLVQGPLKQVDNLTATAKNSTTVLIFWSPPLTLEGVPILGYYVTITNTTSGENVTMPVHIEGDTTMLYHSFNHSGPVNNFTVTVICINKAGPGENKSTTFIMPVGQILPSTSQESSVSHVMTYMQNITSSISSTVTASSSVLPSQLTSVIGITTGVIVIILISASATLILIVIVFIVIKRKSCSESYHVNERIQESDKRTAVSSMSENLHQLESASAGTNLATKAEVVPQVQITDDENNEPAHQDEPESSLKSEQHLHHKRRPSSGSIVYTIQRSISRQKSNTDSENQSLMNPQEYEEIDESNDPQNE